MPKRPRTEEEVKAEVEETEKSLAEAEGPEAAEPETAEEGRPPPEEAEVVPETATEGTREQPLSDLEAVSSPTALQPPPPRPAIGGFGYQWSA